MTSDAAMPQAAERRSPVHHLLEPTATVWGRLAGAPVALRLGPAEEESAAAKALALCDVSALPKVGIRGPAAEAFLRGQGVELPPATYDVLPHAGGLVVRLGSADFFFEGGDMSRFDTMPPGVYRVERQDATFLLCGSRALEVLAQLCSYDFRAAPRRLVLTRAGGVNCGVLPDQVNGIALFRFWVDPTFAVSFWEMLAEIAGELGGRVVGAGCFYPDLERQGT